ncbi:MAG: threonine--tRNA ligase [Gammaproteobacteria bacterium RIFCSPHIGHO2_12_FULL_41_20]|nr:MAG: threonine--tRNA ligase [Gammaproteobacteria bacterium RIFCSPHIGHO2_12_FULL_41_20]
MPVITLPDGSQRQFEKPITIAEIAANIGAGLAKAALAGKVDGKLVDSSFLVEKDATVSIVTDKDPVALEVIRHSAAHLLAQAVKALFPTAQVTIGPVIENGFYYDFAFGRAFTPEDLMRIEEKMQELAKHDFPVIRSVIEREEAIRFFRGMGEEYKAKIIEDIPIGEVLTLYQQGDFIDLCRGPHVPNTGKLKAFKLTKLAGAYWRGNANNEMLQRIYGTAWADKKSLDEYLKNLEEAEKRDHRKIGKHLDLFHFQEEAPGMPFWHAHGWSIYQQIKQYISQRLAENDYQEVCTPQVVDLDLWKKSGHWDMFGEEMFTVQSDDKLYALKPMSCPCHVQIFKQGLRSYRDLPLRMAEFGCCHRNELSGAMHGLMRVRQMVQDDAHIFCVEEQLQAEAVRFMQLLIEVYRDFGFEGIIIKLATRPEKRLGTDALWDNAEHALAEAIRQTGLDYEVKAGEGAFYGPKIEFHLKDCIGRTWQCGTLQLDYAQPQRLEAYYVAEDGSKQHPIMLHRAILGSVERFIGILLEHYAGKLPLWLAPVQAVILNITDKQANYVEEVVNFLRKEGIRVKSDLRNEKIGFKIREHTLQCVPHLLVVGEREVESRTVAVRTREGDDLGTMLLDHYLHFIQTAIARRSRVE